MNELLEYIPLIGFLLSYFLLKDIYTATAILMGLYAVLYLVLKITNRDISRTFRFTLWLVFLFGGLTVVFQNEIFIQWKPTLFSWGCAGVLLLFKFKDKKAFALKTMLGDKLTMEDSGWRFLTNYVALFLLFQGFVNIWVATHLSTENWVTFKVIGLPVLTLIMVLSAFGYLIYTKQLNEENLSDSVTKDD